MTADRDQCCLDSTACYSIKYFHVPLIGVTDDLLITSLTKILYQLLSHSTSYVFFCHHSDRYQILSRFIPILSHRYVPEMQGLVRLTPSLEDFISVLKYHREKLRGVSAAGEDLQPMMVVLESISTNIWKSFYIKKSLHPYSPQALSALKQTLLSCDLLPTLSSTGEPTGIFVSATGETTDLLVDDEEEEEDTDKNCRKSDMIRVISVDDLSLFKMLQGHLTGKVRSGKIHWIYTGHAGGVTDPTELDFDDVNCDLMRLEDDVKETLDLTQSEFNIAVNTIAPETFLAPKSTATLFHFLGVTTLSSLFVTEASTAPSEASRASLKTAAPQDWSPAAFALNIINSLLEIAQRFLYTQGRADLFQLAERGRLKSLLLLQFQDSAYLQRVVRIKPGLLPPEYEGFEMSQTMPFKRDKDPEIPLLINKSCSEGEVVAMGIDLIMHALRIEIALNDQNQRLDLMTSLAIAMDQFAENPNERFRFDYMKIQELPQSIIPWRLKSSSVLKQAVETIEVEVEVEVEKEYPTENVSLRGTKPDQKVLKFIEESKARAMMQRQVAVETKVISAKEAEVIEANKIRQDILSDHLAAIMTDCPTTPNLAGPVLPDPSMEILRYQGLMNPRKADSSEVDDIHRSHGDRALGATLSVAPYTPSDSINESGSRSGGASGSGASSSTNGPESSWHSTASGGHGPVGGAFQGVPFTSVPTRPDVELDFPHALRADLFQNHSLAEMGRLGRSEDVPRVMLSNSTQSGRIGECLAFKYLELKAVELGFIETVWVNSDVESGLPYDIKVLTRDGKVKYCEVKTRSFRDTGDRDREHYQWFISANEVVAAMRLQSDFFALCLSISVNINEGKVTPHSANFIGLEGGFVQALDSKGASLILQDNRSRLPHLTLIQNIPTQPPLPPLTLIQNIPTQLPPLTLIIS